MRSLMICTPQLNDLYSSTNIFRVIKSRRMRLAGYVERMEADRCVQEFGVESWWKETTCRNQAQKGRQY